MTVHLIFKSDPLKENESNSVKDDRNTLEFDYSLGTINQGSIRSKVRMRMYLYKT